MRLKSIKLAGFKSFVDPTTVHLPSNLCAVVGPNGCGKSNIIDAVRWVMGESSAKNLRGESMTDVIFNGSSNRKPVAQASVELIFDNSDRTIKGEYAAFNEIALKRQVNTEAQSTYYLNGTKCRRRDITDIFLGTGLGPRSYSIIEQGMVSRLIESKPEELRVFIEEAAGISKYKERRRETENRIKRTRENLERLTDIREELERQLQHLQRQAKAAEKYREFKQEERDTTAQLNALRWQTLDQEVSSSQQLISELEIKLEASIAEFRATEAEIEQHRSNSSDVTEQYQEIQSAFYSLGGEISRIEQNIDHQRQRKMQLEEDLHNTTQNLEQSQKELNEDLDKITHLEAEISRLEPELESAKAQEAESSAAQESAEEAMQHWQQGWDQFNTHSADSVRKAEVEQQRINHLENIVERGSSRLQSLGQELEGLTEDTEESEINELEERLTALSEQQADLEQRSGEQNKNIEEGRQQLRQANDQLNEKRSELQSLIGRKASLEALQQQALGTNDSATSSWLEANQLAANPRLVDDLKVDSGWEVAVETVLAEHLQAICVEDAAALAENLATFDNGQFSLVDNSTVAPSALNSSLQGRQLAGKISSSRNIASLVAGIYGADSLQEGFSLRNQLGAGESIITREGVWMGAGWLKVVRGFDEKAGMIQRQDELETLAGKIESGQNAVQEIVELAETRQEQLLNLEQQKEELIQQLSEVNRELTEISSDRSARLMKIEQVTERRTRLRQDISELEKQLAVEKDNINVSRASLANALDQMEQDNTHREELLLSRDEYRRVLDQTRQKARQDKDHTHQLALRNQTLQAQLNSLKNTLDRITKQVQSYEQRRTQLEENLKSADNPIPALQEELEEKLASRQDIEANLTAAKTEVDAIEHALRGLEQKRNQSQERSQSIRDELVTNKLGIEGATVKRAALAQQLVESNYDLQTVLTSIAALEEPVTEASCEELLERLGNRIQRLGPINLAAIDEYSTQSERKVYLDSQDADLEKALTTLQNAIHKIDKETRTRFKETFDKINSGLQELFPKIFGGGHAYLDMVGEDLLDTGVAIMARPPGKRNSTIHLLSGGEKAMTAIALVFSIFHLNPSPFCMLDEVDAPLDDANVGRYANLVKEMSEVVQFIFITHNRLTMESAQQLLGVTMHEPGVSRMVSVNIDEAAELAAM